MTVDTHWHVIVPEMTREHASGSHNPEPWRPSVRWEEGSQLVELGGRVVRSAVKEFVRIDRILEQASEMQVDHVLLSPWVNLLPNALAVEEALDVCRIQNQGLSAAAQAYPERLSALGCVPLQDPPRAAKELSAVMGLPGIRGVEIAASCGGAYLGDDRFLPFWEAAEEEGALVFIHPTTRGFDLPLMNDYYLWNTAGNPVETALTAVHMVFAGVLERFPRLKVLLAHGGGALLALRGRLRHAAGFQPQAKARLAHSVDESLRRFNYDTVTHDGELLKALVVYAGADQVLLGSDVPFDMGSFRAVEEVRELDLGSRAEKAILGGNAQRLLGLGGGR